MWPEKKKKKEKKTGLIIMGDTERSNPLLARLTLTFVTTIYDSSRNNQENITSDGVSGI